MSLHGRAIVHVLSDGTSEETVLQMEDGSRLEHVRSATVHLEAGSANKVEVEILGTPLQIKALLDIITLRCPLCGHSNDHSCAGYRHIDKDEQV